MKLIWTFCVINAWGLVSSQSFLYEKMHNYGLGRRVIQNYRRLLNLRNTFDHPRPIPSPSTTPYIASPYHNIYQGVRRRGDKRVYDNRFDFDENDIGQQVMCRGDHPCVINHIKVETQSGVPSLLRGGVGYRYFVVIVRSDPGKALKGRVQAFCYNYTNEFEDTIPKY